MRQQRLRFGELVRVVSAFVRLDAIEDMNYPMSTVFRFASLGLPIFVHFFIAQLVQPGGSAPRPGIGGDYFTFAAVGLTVAGVLQLSLQGFGIRLQFAQDRGTLESLLIEPVPWTLVPFAMNVWHAMLAYVASFLLLGLTLAMGAELDASGALAYLAVITLAMMATTAIGILSASVLILAKRSQPIITIYGLAASLFGGVVFPISLLPDQVRWISYLVPHTYAITGARLTIMARPPEDAPITLAQAFLALAVFDVVALAVGLYAFMRSLHYARSEGLLATY